MNLVIALLAIMRAVNGLLVIHIVDTVFTKGPTHWCNDAVTSATFARSNELGVAIFNFPFLRIRATLLTVLATVLASAECSSRKVLLLIFCFSCESVEHGIIHESQEEDVL